MQHSDEAAIDRFRRRVAARLLLKYSLAGLTVFAFLWGTAVLALRGGVGVQREALLWGLAAAPLFLAPAAWLTWKRLPRHSAVRALLDRHGRCGGLLMAGGEVDLGEWREQVPPFELPRLLWRGTRSWALLACGAGFVLLGFLLPQGFADLGQRRLDVRREVDRLARQIDVLKEEKVLQPARAQTLKEKLEQVRRDAQGRDPVKTLEALDHVQDLANQAAQEASDSAARQSEDLDRAEALSDALNRHGAKLEPAALTEGMAQLSALAKKAASEKELLAAGLDPATLEALQSSALTPEMLKKLGAAFGQCKGGMQRRLAQLVKAGLLDPDALSRCKGNCDMAALAKYLKENGCKGCLCNGLAQCENPGRGGITRGPGPAKLTFGDETTQDGFKFKEEALPPSALESLKDSSVTGITLGAPPSKGDKGPAQAGALAGARAGGGSATTGVVLPRHRAAVEHYFDRSGGKGKQ
jgi:hypothetical protein